jgi:proline iminopeptidase
MEIARVGRNQARQDPEEGYVTVPGGRIWYRMTGGEKPGTPLLVLHGGPGAPHDYLEPLEDLSDERAVIFYDQLGCGNSDKPDNASLWAVARFVEEVDLVCRALMLERVHLLGQSWGAALAVEYMLTRRPHGVSSLVLSGPLLSASRWIQDQKDHLGEFPADVQQVVRNAEASGDFQSARYQDAMMQYYRHHVCRMDPWPDCLNRTIEKLGYPVYEHMWGPSEFSVTGTLRSYERVDSLRQIAVPVLMTCGRHDEATPATTEYYQRSLPGSELHIFEDGSHEHHIECREEYMTVVRRFLSRVEEKWR